MKLFRGWGGSDNQNKSTDQSSPTSSQSVTKFSHDSSKIEITDCINTSDKTIKLTLPKGTWQDKFAKVHKKISKLKLSDNQWLFSINDQTFDPSDVNAFEEILSSIPLPLNLQIVNV